MRRRYSTGFLIAFAGIVVVLFGSLLEWEPLVYLGLITILTGGIIGSRKEVK